MNKIKKIYRCPHCGLTYLTKEWMEQCRAWCAKYQSCNLKITSQAINKKEVR